MSRFLSPNHAKIKPYQPGEQPSGGRFIKLNTNESPFGPSPAVIKAVTDEAQLLQLYPDPQADDLVSDLASYYGLAKEQVITGNGSDEVLALAFLGFCDQSRGICFPDVSYGLYAIYADLYGIPYSKIPLRDDFTLAVEDYFACDGNVIIANPNAPTSLALPLDDIERLLKAKKDSLVIVDEAYVDFGGQSAVGLLNQYDNLLTIRTFSKSRNLAGARLGVAFGCADLIDDMKKMKFSFNPYNVNRLTLAAGRAALADEAYFTKNRLEVMRVRDKTADELRALGLDILPTATNFLFVPAPLAAGGAAFAAALRDRGFLVRHFPGGRTDGFVRVSIGKDEDMTAFVAAVKDIIEEAKR